MYETVFGLTQRPFLAAPRTDRYFPSAAIDEARATLSRCVERAEGVGLLMGPPGTGKTLLCHLLAEHFAGSLQVAVPGAGRIATPRALLQSILYELGRPYREMDEGELRLSLIDHLGSDERSPGGMLLIIDEAQTFSLRLLEELRLINNLVRYGQPRVRLVLSGSPVLEERFAHPKLELFSQRVVARAYLEPLNCDATRGYVIAQIESCGGQAHSIFTDEALTAVHRATDGVPRLINQVCDHVLMLAYAGGRDQISAAGIEEAWADLQQLPTSWEEPSQSDSGQSQGSVIEFGGLEDEPTSDPAVQATYAAAESESASAVAYDQQGAAPPDAAHEDFQPSASDQAEVELVFSKTDETDNESVDDEELVIDRYAEFDRQAWCVPTVINRLEGREMSELLQSHAESRAEDRLKVVDDATDETAEPANDAAAEALEPTTSDAATEALEPTTSDAATEALEPTTSDAAVAAPLVEVTRDDRPTEAYSVRPHEPLGTVRAAMNQDDQFAVVGSPSVGSPVYERMGIDDDLIVIEDDPEEWEPLVNFQQAVARRQEYRGLFARLRNA